MIEDIVLIKEIGVVGVVSIAVIYFYKKVTKLENKIEGLNATIQDLNFNIGKLTGEKYLTDILLSDVQNTNKTLTEIKGVLSEKE